MSKGKIVKGDKIRVIAAESHWLVPRGATGVAGMVVPTEYGYDMVEFIADVKEYEHAFFTSLELEKIVPLTPAQKKKINSFWDDISE
jgi:hypothetical protein